MNLSLCCFDPEAMKMGTSCPYDDLALKSLCHYSMPVRSPAGCTAPPVDALGLCQLTSDSVVNHFLSHHHRRVLLCSKRDCHDPRGFLPAKESCQASSCGCPQTENLRTKLGIGFLQNNWENPHANRTQRLFSYGCSPYI